MQLEPYLFFDGNCEQALAFYARVLGGEVGSLTRYEGTPMAEEMPPETRKNVMHATFHAPSIAFMASDSNRASECETGRIALSLVSKDPVESERVFNALADGGAVSMPYGKMFWGAMFGSLTDRYGIEWMINCELAP
ncbi:MAG: VOC family protein [Vulcanimicrobiaceae bacterium]